jgi:LPS-assembly protein
LPLAEFRGSASRQWASGLTCFPHLAAALFCLLPGLAHAQLSSFAHVATSQTGPRDAPVTFNADSVSYDSKGGLVTLEGHVEAWQNDQVVRADRVTYDRNTNVLAATGHVVLAEPDGQVLFADYAELTQGMRQGVLTGMRALLAQNGRLAANGARRTAGHVNELSRVAYTTCNVCATDPGRAPFWQIRAFSATQDLEHKQIEFRDAFLDIFGLPVLYLPYFATAAPDSKRQSGLLTPGLGVTDKHLGTFVSIPYYYVIDGASDVTVIGEVGTRAGPQIEANYRRRFNDGYVNLRGALAYDQNDVQAFLLGSGQFSYDATWRYGFDVNVASSAIYTRDFRLPGYGADTYASSVYLEGFGVGSYARVDALAFQALNTTVVNQNRLPFVTPRYTYSYFGQPDALGGRLTLDTMDYNVLRQSGTSDQRASLSANWDRPFRGALGERYLATLRVDSAAYHYAALDQQPNFAAGYAGDSAHAQPQAALKVNYPFVRNGAGGSSQLVEPIAQVIVAPQFGTSRRSRIPNEDGLDYEFTDSTLFSLNRYAGQGVDRVDGGARANIALHANWTFAGDQQIDALVGQSYRQHVDHSMLPLTGLENHASDIVARATYVPTGWLDFTGRTRVNHHNGDITYGDGLFSAGTRLLRFNAGYIYDQRNPYTLYDGAAYSPVLPAAYFMQRNEIEIGVNSQRGPYRVSGFARRDIRNNQMVAIGARGTYENECFILDANFFKRYTSILGDNGDTTILFTLTFKTIGQFGFNG